VAGILLANLLPPLSAASGQIMHQAKVLFVAAVLAALGAGTAAGQQNLGAQGAESEPNRLQQWLVPSPDSGHPSHAVLFRPSGDGPFPLAVIAHASV